MKICIFADIHGNGPAFKSAYEMITKEDADLNIFLGDICGYYFDQQQIYEMLSSLPNLIAIKGNHDQMFLELLWGDDTSRKDYRIKYGNSIERLIADGSSDLREWLLKLPESYYSPKLGLGCYHASPWGSMEGYVYPDSSLKKFLDYEPTIFILGHTHYPMVRTISDKLIVNPGSLGQPRNSALPTYAIIDFPSKKVTFREVSYDNAELIKQIDKFGSNKEYLKNFL